jgi:hypothetical protein
MLLREGTDSISTPKTGGNAAQEETCYQCHTINGGLDNVLIGGGGNEVPDIETEFNRTFAKPITNIDQGVTSEQHSITDKDFMESASNLGNNRHVECTDCHNPHRIIKNQLFNADPTIPDAKAHHDHNPIGVPHSNIISGALAGTWGVEPNYGGNLPFGTNPISFTVKSGYAGAGASDDVSSPYVTREYQICLKCHSNYAYGNNPPTSGPTLGTAQDNNMIQYTNQAMEFQAHTDEMGEAAPGTNSDQNIDESALVNHRSWHPVMNKTGRTLLKRGLDGWTVQTIIFNAPWQDDGGLRIGEQTMYCSDCHGSASPYIEGDTSTHKVDPAPGAAWGPHGSDEGFILKGKWDVNTTISLGTQLCFRCHKISEYGGGNNENTPTGFSSSNGNNLHDWHAGRLGGRLRCTWCHVAVPHGWRNKALLVDIANDPEAASCGGASPCNAPPYYIDAYLGGNVGGVNWRVSGEWSAQDCNTGSGGCFGWMGGMMGGDGSGTSCRSPQ